LGCLRVFFWRGGGGGGRGGRGGGVIGVVVDWRWEWGRCVVEDMGDGLIGLGGGWWCRCGYLVVMGGEYRWCVGVEIEWLRCL
jgi:hypothetical protein